MTLKTSDARQVWLKRNDVSAMEDILVGLCAHKDLQFIIAICGKRTGVIRHKTFAFLSEQVLEIGLEVVLKHLEKPESLDELGAGAGVLIYLTAKSVIWTTTWSVKKADCDRMGDWRVRVIEPAHTVVPFRTVFGMNTGGEPMPLTDEEKSTMSPADLRWVEKFAA